MLLDLEASLENYNKDVILKLASGLGIPKNSTSNVIDFGAGSGTLAKILRTNFGVDPICIEIDNDLKKNLESNGFRVFRSIQEVESKISLVYTSNVLEHLEDDVKELIAIREKMQVGGLLAIYVPALPILFSDLDRTVGHYRRYGRMELISKVESAGYHVRSCYYNDFLGVPVSLLFKIFGLHKSLGFGSVKSLQFYDRVIYRISKIIDNAGGKRLIGKNLILVARNPDT